MNTSSQRTRTAWADEALLQALVQGDRAAFAEIYERYWQRLLGLAYQKLKSREVAEELVQDLFATLWHKRTEHQIEHLEHYLVGAINRRILGHLRAHQVRTAYLDYCRWHQQVTTQETEQTLAEADLSEAFAKALLCLPEQSREIFRMSRLEHVSVQEIAERLQLSTKAVEYHLTKSRRLLRGYLRDFVVTALFMFFI